MNLDLAIQNVLKRSEMENAMHGVMSNFGGSYQLTSYTESAKSAESILGTPVAQQLRPTLETAFTPCAHIKGRSQLLR